MRVRICPIAECDATVGDEKLFCLAHWGATPKPLREEVWRTWLDFKNSKGEGVAIRLLCRVAYLAAKSEAEAFHA